MIAKVKSGRAFSGLARYLETGREGNDPDRVAWTEARNLPTNDPHTASLIMRATAAQSVRTEKPVYHIALSFDPDDAVDRATMVQVADRLKRDLGLQEHQALIVAHGDTRHPHLHIMINRVHPETFRAWDPKHDYAQIERSLREQERELNFRGVSGRHYRLDGQDRPDQAEALAMNGDHHQRPREQMSTEHAPRAHEENGRQTTGRNVSEVTQPSPSPERRPDLARPSADGRAAPAGDREDRTPALGVAGRRTASAGQDASTAGRSHGVDADRPHRANRGHEDTRRSSSRALDPRLDRVRQTINHLDQRTQLERTRDRARDDLDRARVRLILPNSHRTHARTTSRQFRAALAEVYRDPVAARRAFHAEAKQIGDPAAAAELARRPQRFGQLHGTQVGPAQSPARVAALKAVPKLEHLGGAHLRDVREAWASRAEYREARGTVRRLEREIQTLDQQLGRTPGRAQLEHKLARQIRGLQPPEHQKLLRSLPIPHRKVLSAAITVAREFAREQGQER